MALDKTRIQKSISKLRKLLGKAPKRPTPEEIHDLRTQARRFETAMVALALDSKKNERRLLRNLAGVRRRAGKIRDMDVFTEHAAKVRGEPECLIQVREYLGAERYRHSKQLHALAQETGKTIRRRLKRTSIRIEKLLPDGMKKASDSINAAPADAMATALELATELATPATLNKNNLHQYRLKVKELRYVLQMADHPGNREFMGKLTEIKDAIGEWHDWEELIGIASGVLAHQGECKFLRETKAISHRKYQHALALANKLRREYLRSSDGAGKRASAGSAARVPAAPVLEATSAIAS